MSSLYDLLGDTEGTLNQLNALRRYVHSQDEDAVMTKIGYRLDILMNTSYHCLLYTFNIVLLMTSPEVVDILLNALAVRVTSIFFSWGCSGGKRLHHQNPTAYISVRLNSSRTSTRASRKHRGTTRIIVSLKLERLRWLHAVTSTFTTLMLGNVTPSRNPFSFL